MVGAATDAGENGDSLRVTLTVSGLAPGETLTLLATGEYGVQWVCGAPIEPCGELGCVPPFSDRTEGSARATAQSVADVDGTVKAQSELVAAAPTKPCPDASASGWGAMWARWEKVSIADSVHRLVLTPAPIEWGVTY